LLLNTFFPIVDTCLSWRVALSMSMRVSDVRERIVVILSVQETDVHC